MDEDESYRYYLTYLTYHKEIQSMIYTTNWIERLQRTFRRVLRFRTALPNEQSALTLMGKTAMDIRCYQRKIPQTHFLVHYPRKRKRIVNFVRFLAVRVSYLESVGNIWRFWG